MAYIRQKNTGDSEIVVIENGEVALAAYPDLFELVNADLPDKHDCLVFISSDVG